MRFAEEIVVSFFVPTWRSLLVQALHARGLRQNDIAPLVGLTQSAVSKHLAGRPHLDERLAAEPALQEAVARVADGLAAGTLSPFQALLIAEDLVRRFEDRGPICRIHEEEMPALRGLGCDLCVRGGGSALLPEQIALHDLRQALRALEALPGAAALVPHVGANFVRAVEGAQDATRVAAVPGRLYESRGFVKVPAPPELGVSGHVAKVLVAVLRQAPDRLAAINLAPTQGLLDGARRLGLRVAEVPPDVERRPADLAFAGEVPDLFHHEGAFGIEPQAYLVGKDAQAVVATLRRLVA